MFFPLFFTIAAVTLGTPPPPSQAAPDPVPAAQESQALTDSSAQTPEDSPYKFTVDATLVNVNVMVTDEDGTVLSGLKKGNFRVLDNGVPQEIIDFSPATAPITIVMLMEYSSASYDYFAYKAAEWSSRFLDHLEPRDWVALVTYDIQSKVRVDFTHERYKVRDELFSLGFPAFSETNLFDALIDTLDKLDHVKGRTSILLMTTGSNSFSAATLDDVFKRLRQSDVTIFSVNLAEQEYVRYGSSNIAYLQAKSALTAFSERTGGIAYFPRFAGELPDIFRSVAGYLRSEYSLSFRPPLASRDGRFHRLKVEIVGPDGKPLKVTNEKGKQRKVEVYTREGYTAPKARTP
ncbi:MAG: VWA domain-containing protein [Acidobacteriota bacterium]|nr:VWA domain-containing protein [Acidobacteriota bacterium]